MWWGRFTLHWFKRGVQKHWGPKCEVTTSKRDDKNEEVACNDEVIIQSNWFTFKGERKKRYKDTKTKENWNRSKNRNMFENSCHYLKSDNKDHPCCLRGWASTFLSIWTTLSSLWLWPNIESLKKITTAVPLKTPMWGTLRNVSWGRLERRGSLSWDWTH